MTWWNTEHIKIRTLLGRTENEFELVKIRVRVPFLSHTGTP